MPKVKSNIKELIFINILSSNANLLAIAIKHGLNPLQHLEYIKYLIPHYSKKTDLPLTDSKGSALVCLLAFK